jgi:hypothetical protein
LPPLAPLEAETAPALEGEKLIDSPSKLKTLAAEVDCACAVLPPRTEIAAKAIAVAKAMVVAAFGKMVRERIRFPSLIRKGGAF